jgi:hypothetical protein
MREAGARGPASPPNMPPTSMIKGVSPRAAPVVPTKGSPPAPPVTPAKPTAPLAAKVAPQTVAAVAKPIRQPSSPGHPVAPLPPRRSVPDASPKAIDSSDNAQADDTQVDHRAPLAAMLRSAAAQPPPVVQPPPLVQPPPVVQPPPLVQPSPPVQASPPTPAFASMPPIDVSFDRASVPAPSPPREDPEARVRAAVAEAVAPLNQTIRELQRRIEELERRPVQQSAAAFNVLPSGAAASAVEPYRQPQASYPGAIAVPVAAPSAPAVIARAPEIDLAAIARSGSVDMEGALDGRRRRRNLAIKFVVFLVVVFGGLFAALANSYSPH